MNRELLVTLLRKDIRELDMITEGFMEMKEYPHAIILLAKQKTEDIQEYIKQLSCIKPEPTTTDIFTPVWNKTHAEEVKPDTADINPEVISEITEDNETSEALQPEQEIRTEVAEPEEAPELHKTGAVFETVTIIEPIASPVIDTLIKPTPAEKQTVVSRNEIMAKADNSLSSVLANKKITDIKQAINIGDRFRFQRELFKSNGEDMNKTLNYINQLATLEEAMSFLRSKYSWPDENETTEDFLQIVRRRFL